MKQTAAFRSKRYDLAVDTISDGDLAELVTWLQQSPRLTMGPVTKQFEDAWSEWLGVKYSVMCNSGSSADLLMYAALDSAGRSGSRRIVVPATGWVTTLAPGIQLGWESSMCATDPQTFGMDPRALEDILAGKNIDAVIVVHELGVPSNLTQILALQEKYGFILLEDCCASHGALHQGQMVGTFGLMSAFSFYYGHHMSTIEGGIVSTNDEELYHHLLMQRSHGWLKDLPEDKANAIMAEHEVDPFRSPFTFLHPGYNLRSTDLNAQLGLIQLHRLDETIAIRKANHLVYQERLRGVLRFAEAMPGDTISSISFCAVAESTEQRRQIINELDTHDIDTRIFAAGNLGRHPFWTSRHGRFEDVTADMLYDGGFFLPNNQSLDAADINHVCDVVCEACTAATR